MSFSSRYNYDHYYNTINDENTACVLVYQIRTCSAGNQLLRHRLIGDAWGVVYLNWVEERTARCYKWLLPLDRRLNQRGVDGVRARETCPPSLNSIQVATYPLTRSWNTGKLMFYLMPTIEWYMYIDLSRVVANDTLFHRTFHLKNFSFIKSSKHVPWRIFKKPNNFSS